MSLGSTDITTTAVNTELGSPLSTPYGVDDLYDTAGQNVYSFYGAGTISISSHLPVLDVSGQPSKLGDFRLYNHSATTPHPQAATTMSWGPGGVDTDMIIPVWAEDMNIYEITGGSAVYYRYNMYLSTANRRAETSLLHGRRIPITSSAAPLYNNGHTRNQQDKPLSLQYPWIHDIPTTGLTTPNDFIYVDTFISNLSDVRQFNLGAHTSSGYTTITTHELQPPEILSTGTIPSPPSGYTVIFGALSTTSARCDDDDPLPGGTIGTTGIAFYFGYLGIYSPDTRAVQATSVTIRITYDGSTSDVVLGTVGSAAKSSVSTTLPGGKTWAYDKDAVVTTLAATFASTPTYNTC